MVTAASFGRVFRDPPRAPQPKPLLDAVLVERFLNGTVGARIVAPAERAEAARILHRRGHGTVYISQHLHMSRAYTRAALGMPEPAPPADPPRDDCAWMASGLCREVGSGPFFQNKGESSSEAKAVCLRCPVQDECLAYAIARPELEGIWGATSERDRMALRRRQYRMNNLGKEHRRLEEL